MRLNCVIGVDPGFSGALAIFDPSTGWLSVVDMPLVVQKTGKRCVDLPRLAACIKEWQPQTVSATVEAVHSMPGQGVASTFAFGRSYGHVEASLAAFGIPINHVAPALWKQQVGVTANKRTSMARASEILPEYADLWKLAKHDGRAEAALLAVYGAALQLRYFKCRG